MLLWMSQIYWSDFYQPVLQHSSLSRPRFSFRGHPRIVIQYWASARREAWQEASSLILTQMEWAQQTNSLNARVTEGRRRNQLKWFNFLVWVEASFCSENGKFRSSAQFSYSLFLKVATFFWLLQFSQLELLPKFTSENWMVSLTCERSEIAPFISILTLISAALFSSSHSSQSGTAAVVGPPSHTMGHSSPGHSVQGSPQNPPAQVPPLATVDSRPER